LVTVTVAVSVRLEVASMVAVMAWVAVAVLKGAGPMPVVAAGVTVAWALTEKSAELTLLSE
jgi:hypothetical protein